MATSILFNQAVCSPPLFLPTSNYLLNIQRVQQTLIQIVCNINKQMCIILWMVLSLVCSTCLSNEQTTQIKKNKNKKQTWTMHTCYIFWTFHYSIYSSHCTWCNHREIQFYHNNGDFVWQSPLSYVFWKQEVHIINRMFHMAYSL